MPNAAKPKLTDTEPVTDLVQLARETAYDRYIQALLIKPNHRRTDFLVLAAFHGELARIPLLVREPMMGEIRLQWWHDVVAATEFMAEDAAPDFASPLANHVAALIARIPKARGAFLTAIESRGAELDVQTLANPTDFERYLDGVGCALFGVGIKVLGIEVGSAEQEALRVGGHAVACAELALRVARLAELGRTLAIAAPSPTTKTAALPAQKTSTEPTVSHAITALSEHARASVKAYRDLQPQLSAQMTEALLPLALVEPYFKALQRARSVHPRSQVPKSPLARFVTLWWAAKRSRL